MDDPNRLDVCRCLVRWSEICRTEVSEHVGSCLIFAAAKDENRRENQYTFVLKDTWKNSVEDVLYILIYVDDS